MSSTQAPGRRWIILLEILLLVVIAALAVSVLMPSLGSALYLRQDLAGGVRGAATAGKPAQFGTGLSEGGATGLDNAGATALPDAPPGLKLVYMAAMSVAVEKDQADAFPAKLAEQVRTCGGYVTEAFSLRQAGQSPSGHLTIRVPSDKLNELMDWIAGQAAVVYRQLAVQDITEQYVDLDARLTNLKNAEGRLTELLAKETGKLEEVLKVEQEIRQVRLEIDQLQGRKRLWDQQVALSTLTVDYEVPGVYGSDRPLDETFPQRASQAWGESWRGFTAGMATAAVWAIYAWPWLAVLAIVIAVAWACRRLVRRKRAV